MWSQSHYVIIGDAIADLPHLPLSQDHLVWVWHHMQWVAQQDKEQEAGKLLYKGKSVIWNNLQCLIITVHDMIV